MINNNTFKIGLITPLKNERGGIIKFLKSINNQSIKIDYLLIIENDSTDGSDDFLKKIKYLQNVKHFEVLNKQMKNKKYELGVKYSSVVKSGFDHLINNKSEIYKRIDFLGILDADCYPEPEYFEKLTNKLLSDKKIGLVGGVLYVNENSYENKSSRHIRGSGRLWKKECFIDSDYKIGVSADANSLIRAKVAGWKAEVVKDAKFFSRPANSRVSKEYAGKSAYYNGFSKTYIFAKFIKNFITDPIFSVSFIKGYLKEWINDSERNKDQVIIDYNKRRLYNKFIETIYK